MRMYRAEESATWTTLDNLTVDDDLSCRALGLLTRWLRRPPGVEIDSIPDMVKRAKRSGAKNLEGRDALYAASYELERAGYVVRRLMHHKNGTHEWICEVYSRPVPPEQRTNPDDRKRATKDTPKAAPARRTHGQKTAGEKPPKAPVPENPDSGPVPGFQDSAHPDSAHPDSESQGSSSKYSANDSSSSTAPQTPATSRATSEEQKKIDNQEEPPQGQAVPSPAAVPTQREESEPAPGDGLSSGVRQIVLAWSEARVAAGVGPHRRPGALEEFQASATALVKAGKPVEWLIAVARWMAAEKPAWAGLGEAAKAQYAGAPAEPMVQAAPRRLVDPCPSHPSLEAAGCRHCTADAVVDRQRRELDEKLGIDDESSRQFMAAFLAQARQPRTSADRRRDAATRQAGEVRSQSAKRARFLAG
ncbi:hypothetical protein [Streptomyces sp. NRRL WC-3742]|uniref:hypothetical protein n=1 Tax=Streptomyces sp. NRRL WC-3742 TaxID=1463934 RepID=UPI0004CB7FCD|nr:hypothetical protein [Streptomyces sp. NRRL WC-3742]